MLNILFEISPKEIGRNSNESRAASCLQLLPGLVIMVLDILSSCCSINQGTNIEQQSRKSLNQTLYRNAEVVSIWQVNRLMGA